METEYKKDVDFFVGILRKGGIIVLDYEITSNTCALIGLNENETEVIEKNKHFIVNKKTKDVLKNSCEYYGSTLDGQTKGSQLQLGMKYKLPIIVESTNELIFFPTISPRMVDCSWISLKNIKKYEGNTQEAQIEFLNNEKITLPISIESLENQIFRATKLMLIARKRREM